MPYFTKKIPSGAEAANVLIGEVPFLQQKIIAFIRLEESVYLGLLSVCKNYNYFSDYLVVYED